MGIIMCVLMGLALMLIKPLKRLYIGKLFGNKKLVKIFAIAVFFGGCWNTVWYGLNTMNNVWGLIAIGSGMLMILASLFILLDRKIIDETQGGNQRASTIFQYLLSIGLLVFFSLYFVTLVRLNLGLSILQ